MARVHCAYREADLPRHPDKSVSQARKAEFWGGSFDGVEGTVRPNHKRTIPLSSLLLRTVEVGFATPELLEIYAGSLISAFQLRRRLLSVLDRVYAEPRGLQPKAIFRMSPCLRSELLTSIVLLPQAVMDFRTPGAPVLVASDASSHSEAAVCLNIRAEVSVECCRHGLQKGLWNRLLKPLGALQRERGELPDGDQLPGACYSSHPIWETACRTQQFRPFGRIKRVKRRRHINLGELRAALAAECRVGRSWPSSRYLHLQDSQVSLACLVKGRSSSGALNAALRKSLPDHLGFNVKPAYGFIKTHWNPADDPTRDKPVRLPCEDTPRWFEEFLRGSFEGCDSYLAKLGVHLDQLRGLPSVRELMPDAEIPEYERARPTPPALKEPAERLAQHLLKAEFVSRADLVRLLRMLPGHRAPRGEPGLHTKCFFTGLFAHGGVVGFRSAVGEYPLTTRVLCKFVRGLLPGLRFSSIGLMRNMRADAHVDSHNAEEEPNMLLGLTRFSGGGLWIAGEGGTEFRSVKGRLVPGRIVNVGDRPVLFDPHRPHCTEPWKGSRYVLVTYCVRGLQKLSESQRAAAKDLGLSLPEGAVLEDDCWVPSNVAEPRSAVPPSPGIDKDPKPPEVARRRCTELEVAERPQLHKPLGARAQEALAKVAPGQFVYSPVFPSLSAALGSGPGWVDLFSGSRGVAKALVEAAPWWVLCYDLKHDQEENLLFPTVQAEVIELLASGAVLGFSADPPAGTFSSAISPAWRTKAEPRGSSALSLDQSVSVARDNALGDYCVPLTGIAVARGLEYVIANPAKSWLWKQAGWGALEGKYNDFFADFCRFGTPWRKASRFRCSGQLGGQRLLCNCGRPHVHLRGRCKTRGVSWTTLAEPFPKRLCKLLASALAQDAGHFAENRELDIAKCAKAGSGRIGEAKNPGPRRSQPRTPACLSEVQLVEPRTAALRDRHWSAFLQHLREHLGSEGAASVLRVPALLVSMLCQYSQVLYDAGTPLHYYRQILAHAQQVCPQARPIMRPAWDFVSRWERLEPLQHRPPLPEVLLRAMAAIGLSWQWERWTAITLLCFYGIARIGEALNACRRDLLTPEDALEPQGRLYLIIRSPKTRHRGARVQHIEIQGPGDVIDFVIRTFQDLEPSTRLFGGSPGVYRRRWDEVLRRLEVPAELRLTPGSLRGGGAVAAHKRGVQITDLQWRMRLGHQNTLAYYLQETTAASVLPSLATSSRANVLAAERCLPFFLSPKPAHSVARGALFR